MEKIDLKKVYKDLYNQPKNKISIVGVPEFSYLVINGEGDPNKDEYKNAIEALYSVAYTIKFNVKKSNLNIDYSVMPLEGLWWAFDMSSFKSGNKDKWKWTSLILQPEFITKEIVSEAIDQVKKKKDPTSLSKIQFEKLKIGLSAQILHIGPYSDEEPTINELHDYIKDNGYDLTGKHQEIYLSDPRRTAPEKLRTIIRQPIKK